MNDVAFDINHDVTIVPVFDLKQVANQTVGGHGADKVAASHLEFLSVFVAVRLNEIFIEANVRLTSELVSRFGVRNTFNHATAGRSGYDTIRKKEKIQIHLLEYILE